MRRFPQALFSGEHKVLDLGMDRKLAVSGDPRIGRFEGDLHDAPARQLERLARPGPLNLTRDQDGDAWLQIADVNELRGVRMPVQKRPAGG